MAYYIYSSKLQLNEANVQILRPYFWGFTFIIIRCFLVKTKIYDKRDNFDFDHVDFPFLDHDDVPYSTSCGVHIVQLIRFARVSSHVDNFVT